MLWIWIRNQYFRSPDLIQSKILKNYNWKIFCWVLDKNSYIFGLWSWRSFLKSSVSSSFGGQFGILLDLDPQKPCTRLMISNVQGGYAGLGHSRSELLHRIHPAWRLEAGASRPRTTAQPLPAQVRRRPKFYNSASTYEQQVRYRLSLVLCMQYLPWKYVRFKLYIYIKPENVAPIRNSSE